MNIGQASKASGVSAKMIRYYEQIGLLPPAERTESGYRAYTNADVHKLRFVRRARDLGFPVAEIADLLGLWNDHARRSADVKRVARGHIAELIARMNDLQQMIDTLGTLVDSCAGDERPDCPILAGLEQGSRNGAQTKARTGAVTRRQRTDKGPTGRRVGGER